jgi:hypothetical protein
MTQPASRSRLKLRIQDEEDLRAAAAVLQDALVPIGEMAYLPEEKRFAMVTNRFCWECEAAQRDDLPDDDTAPLAEDGDAAFAADHPSFERVHTGISFEGVTGVRLRGIDRRRRMQLLELLTILLQDGKVYLLFAGDAAIELTVEALRGRIEDLCEPWPTRWRPHHPAAKEGDAAG